MNILFITHVSSLYGANRSLIDIVEALDKKKFSIHIMGPGRGDLFKKCKMMGVIYQAIPMCPTIHDVKVFDDLVSKSYKNSMAIKKIINYIKIKKIDIVHTNSSTINLGAIASWLTNTRHFWHIRELDIQYNFKKDCALFDHFLMRKAEKIICISQYVHTNLYKEYRGNNVITYYNPIDIKKYIINRQELFPAEQIKILCCGALVENKKQMVVVKAIEILRERGITNLKLIIVGSGFTYAKQIQRYVQKKCMQNYVEMHPFCEDLSEYRKMADMAIMSSVYEALGRVTIESMLSELVLIGAASGATDELIRNQYNGLKYTPDSPIELANAIEYMITHKEEAMKMVKNAKKWAISRFNAEKRIEKLEGWYLEGAIRKYGHK